MDLSQAHQKQSAHKREFGKLKQDLLIKSLKPMKLKKLKDLKLDFLVELILLSLY